MKNISAKPQTYLTVQDVAALFGCGVSTVWRWAKKGSIPAPRKIGGMVRWTRADLLAQFPELANDAA